MPKRKRSKAMKRRREPTAIELQRETRRKEAVGAVIHRNQPVSVVARVFNTTERSVFNWLSLYRAGGWDALKEGKRRGRKRKVSPDDMKWLYDKVTLGDPRQFKFPFCLWTLDVIRTMLKQERGIKLSKSGVSRLLGHLGLSPQRPIYRSYKQSPKELEKYLRTTFPALRRLAKRIGAEIYFVDEAAVRSDCHHGTTWGRAGQTPVAEDSGDRFTLKLISAVTARGDMRFGFIEGRMNSEKFIAFLRKLRADAGKPIIVIADNASYHNSKAVMRFAEESEGEIHIRNLPAYAPEYNPDEQVWNHAKRRLGKLFVVTKEETRDALMRIMQSIQRCRSLVASFFKLEKTRYAATPDG